LYATMGIQDKGSFIVCRSAGVCWGVLGHANLKRQRNSEGKKQRLMLEVKEMLRKKNACVREKTAQIRRYFPRRERLHDNHLKASSGPLLLGFPPPVCDGALSFVAVGSNLRTERTNGVDSCLEVLGIAHVGRVSWLGEKPSVAAEVQATGTGWIATI
jgi:hypothetical protein